MTLDPLTNKEYLSPIIIIGKKRFLILYYLLILIHDVTFYFSVTDSLVEH